MMAMKRKDRVAFDKELEKRYEEHVAAKLEGRRVTIFGYDVRVASPKARACERGITMKDKSKISTPDLRTTVFEAQYPEDMVRSDPTGFKCLECGFVQPCGFFQPGADARGWKFCPSCAAEIMRFARDPEREPEETEVVDQHAHHIGTVRCNKPKEKY